MMSGTQFSQGEIVLVPVPFTNLRSVKQRPVLILASFYEDVIVCGITSNISSRNNTVLITQSDIQGSTLPKTSQIRVDKIFTLHKSMIRKQFGTVNKNKFKEVKTIFKNLV